MFSLLVMNGYYGFWRTFDKGDEHDLYDCMQLLDLRLLHSVKRDYLSCFLSVRISSSIYLKIMVQNCPHDLSITFFLTAAIESLEILEIEVLVFHRNCSDKSLVPKSMWLITPKRFPEQEAKCLFQSWGVIPINYKIVFCDTCTEELFPCTFSKFLIVSVKMVTSKAALVTRGISKRYRSKR